MHIVCGVCGLGFDTRKSEPCGPSGTPVESGKSVFQERSQAHLAVTIANLSSQLGKCRIGVNRRSKLAEAVAMFHCQHKLVQQIASVPPPASHGEPMITTL